jgi:hypothetical protein
MDKIIQKLKSAAGAVKSFFSNAVAETKEVLARMKSEIGLAGTIAVASFFAAIATFLVAGFIVCPIETTMLVGLMVLYGWLRIKEEEEFDREIQAITDREVARLNETLNSVTADFFDNNIFDNNIFDNDGAVDDDTIDYSNVIDVDFMEIN